ncbi:MAG: hypothetical protein AAFX06_32650 [Planctomycetota bacterium]
MKAPTPNPYEAPESVEHGGVKREKPLHWRVPCLMTSAIIATVTFYGFFVRAGFDPQWVAFVIAFFWFLGILSGAFVILLAVVRRPKSNWVRSFELAMLFYISIAAVIGFMGVGYSVRELLAG